MYMDEKDIIAQTVKTSFVKLKHARFSATNFHAPKVSGSTCKESTQAIPKP